MNEYQRLLKMRIARVEELRALIQSEVGSSIMDLINDLVEAEIDLRKLSDE